MCVLDRRDVLPFEDAAFFMPLHSISAHRSNARQAGRYYFQDQFN
jgi:hypothetical protein